MSGLEVAGVLLGTFPLIIAAIEHWRNCAKVGGYLWKARKEFSRCEKDVSFNEIIYKRNLKELLIPIVGEAADVDALVGDPGGQGWRDQALHEKLVARLQESYKVYLEIVEEMNETAEEIRKELCFDQASVQQKLAPPPDARKGCQPSPRRPPKTLISKSAVDYQIFRAKFCLGGKKREDLFAQLKECNQRLKKLLSTSDKMFALQNAPPSTTKQISALETAFKKAYQKSELLFRALQNSWNCTCQQYHFANLRLEHRNSVEVCFEIILMFIRPLEDYEKPWNWRALQCGGHTKGCLVMPRVSSHQTQPRPAPAKLGLPPPTPPPTPLVTKTRKVAFSTSNKIASTVEVENVVNPPFHLCKLLGGRPESSCLGIIGHGDGEYHLHPLNERKEPAEDGVLTLDFILSSEFEGSLSRRGRYSIALLLASSVAQLQFTPWLRTGLTKECVLFFRSGDHSDVPFSEPFIRQGFSSEQTPPPGPDDDDYNFSSLGILLLELCFGERLEDHRLRRKHAATDDADAKRAFDLMAAVQWSRGVCDEGGEDYAAAVTWCFTGAGSGSKNWRTEMIKNVIRPLEMCQEHFKTAATA